MKAKDIMTQYVACVKPDTTVAKSAEMMKELNVGSLPVCSDKGVVGIVTDRDIVVRCISESKNPQDTLVENIMTYNVATAAPNTDTQDVARLMAKNKVRRIPVVENEALIGIVALGDLAADMRFDMEASEALSEISIPTK